MLNYFFSSGFSPGPAVGLTATDARLIAETQTQALEQRVAALELACAALWTILKEQNGWTDDMLVNAIREVDARDGVVDGKITHSQLACPNCGRRRLTRCATRCSWCGAELPSPAI